MKLIYKSMLDTVVCIVCLVIAVAVIVGFIWLAANTSGWLFLIIPVGLLFWGVHHDNVQKAKRDGTY